MTVIGYSGTCSDFRAFQSSCSIYMLKNTVILYYIQWKLFAFKWIPQTLITTNNACTCAENSKYTFIRDWIP